MRTWATDVGITVRPGNGLELRVVDLSHARAFFEGTPAALVGARSTLTGEHLAAYVGA